MQVQVSDELWSVIAPLLPPAPSHAKGGRPRVSDRRALNGILFVLRTGIPWNYLPSEGPWASGPTCWRRLHEWQEAGVWTRLHQVLLDRLGVAGRIDWSRAALDSSGVPAKGVKKGRKQPGPARVTRGSRARSDT
jgi:transposase